MRLDFLSSDTGCRFVDNICRESIQFLWNQVVRSWKKGKDFDANNFLSPINNDVILGAYYLFFISWKINSEREKGTVGDTMHGQRPEGRFFFAIK